MISCDRCGADLAEVGWRYYQDIREHGVNVVDVTRNQDEWVDNVVGTNYNDTDYGDITSTECGGCHETMRLNYSEIMDSEVQDNYSPPPPEMDIRIKRLI